MVCSNLIEGTSKNSRVLTISASQPINLYLPHLDSRSLDGIFLINGTEWEVNAITVNRKAIDLMQRSNRIHIPALFAILGSILSFWSTALLAGQITVAWDANPDPRIGGYKLYYRQIAQGYSSIDVGYQTSFTLLNLMDGKAFCITASVYDITRTLESGLSEEICKQLPPALQDMNGDGAADLAGVNSNGRIYYTLNRSTWINIPGQIKQLAVGDLDGNGIADLAGISSAGNIYYSTNLSTWTHIPGWWLDQIKIKDINGDGSADIVGLSGGSIYYTINLITWTNIPGWLAVLDNP